MHVDSYRSLLIHISLYFLLLSTISNGYSQVTKIQFEKNLEKIEIPFQLVNGFIMLEVLFAQKIPMKFIFDTGAENTVLLKKEFTDVLNIPYSKKIMLRGSDLFNTIEAYVVNGISLQLTNMPEIKQNILVVTSNYINIEEYTGYNVDGIIGMDIMRLNIFRIDYKRNLITIINPKKFKAEKLKGYDCIPMELISNKPYINCDIEVNPGIKTNSKLLVDSGAALTTLLHQNTDTLMAHKGLIISGQLGLGLGGKVEGYIGKVEALKIGSVEFNRFFSYFQELDSAFVHNLQLKRNGIIGSYLLQRFDIIFDMINKNLYLKLAKKQNKEFNYDKSGLTIFSFGPNLNKYYVKYVIPYSPADLAGIKEGDVLLSINRWPMFFFNLQKINRVFSKRIGKKIELKIRRGDEVIKLNFITKDIFIPNGER